MPPTSPTTSGLPAEQPPDRTTPSGLDRARPWRLGRVVWLEPPTTGVSMKRSALFLPALALAVGLVTAGCGGSDDDSLTHDEFVTQADKICSDGNADLADAAGSLDPNDEAAVSSF